MSGEKTAVLHIVQLTGTMNTGFVANYSSGL